MKNKINKKITLSLITLSVISTTASAWFIGGKEILEEHPLKINDRSIENGGLLPAITTATDGAGVLVTSFDDTYNVDNSAFNNLVYIFGEPALKNGTTLGEQVLTQSNAINEDGVYNWIADVIIKDSELNKLTEVDGTACDDNNPDTINDVYSGGICLGTCDDGNPNTVDTFVNGACVFSGLSNPDGTPCDDGDAKTINDVYTNDICSGINVEGQSCDDNNPQTINDIYMNGICAGTLINCDDNNPDTIDTLTNGICSNVYIDGTSCDDGNSDTINDVYTNGICKGVYSVSNIVTDQYGNTYNTMKMMDQSIWIGPIEGRKCPDGFLIPTTVQYLRAGGLKTLPFPNKFMSRLSVLTSHFLNLKTTTEVFPNTVGYLKTKAWIFDDTVSTAIKEYYKVSTRSLYIKTPTYSNMLDSPFETRSDRELDGYSTKPTYTTYCRAYIPDGTPCDDGDPSTHDDIWRTLSEGEQNECIGLPKEYHYDGTACDDGNPNTYNDMYYKNKCIADCNDGDVSTIDFYDRNLKECFNVIKTDTENLPKYTFGISDGTLRTSGLLSVDPNFITDKGFKPTYAVGTTLVLNHYKDLIIKDSNNQDIVIGRKNKDTYTLNDLTNKNLTNANFDQIIDTPITNIPILTGNNLTNIVQFKYDFDNYTWPSNNGWIYVYPTEEKVKINKVDFYYSKNQLTNLDDLNPDVYNGIIQASMYDFSKNNLLNINKLSEYTRVNSTKFILKLNGNSNLEDLSPLNNLKNVYVKQRRNKPNNWEVLAYEDFKLNNNFYPSVDEFKQDVKLYLDRKNYQIRMSNDNYFCQNPYSLKTYELDSYGREKETLLNPGYVCEGFDRPADNYDETKTYVEGDKFNFKSIDYTVVKSPNDGSLWLDKEIRTYEYKAQKLNGSIYTSFSLTKSCPSTFKIPTYDEVYSALGGKSLNNSFFNTNFGGYYSSNDKSFKLTKYGMIPVSNTDNDDYIQTYFEYSSDGSASNRKVWYYDAKFTVMCKMK